MVDFSSQSVRRGTAPERLLTALAGGLVFLAAGSAAAQTTVYTDQYGNPTVEVDLSVLDKLGPPQNLPDIYRPPGNGESRGDGLLAPPPREMPRSHLSLPKDEFELKAAGSRTAPPPREDSVARTKPVEVPAPAKLTPPKRVEPPKPAPAPAEKASPPSPPAPPKVASAPKVSPPAVKPPSVSPPTPPQAPAVPAVEAPEATSAPAPPPLKTPAEDAKPATAGAPAPPPVKAPAPTQPSAPKTAALSPSESQTQTTAAAGTIAISPDGGNYKIPFAADATDLPENASPALDNLAERMSENDGLRLQLLGYAGSEAGSASQARRKSLFRALAVRTYLMKQGVRSTRMDVRALGQGSEGGPQDRVDIVVVQ